MAVWQVDFFVVPRRAIAGAPQPLTRAVVADTNWWSDAKFPTDFRSRLAALGPATEATPTMEAWGVEDGNRVEVKLDNGRAMSMRVRTDVRRLDSKFGAAVIVFARAADAVLVRADGLVIEPTIATYAAALRGSTAWRHASDTAAFLADRAAADDELD